MKYAQKSIGRAIFAAAAALALLPSAVSASPFTDSLSKDYFKLARVQYYYSHDKFAVKARAADQGKNVLPDDPSKLKVPASARTELIAARARLITALDAGFRTQDPKQAARAQTMYDCWLWAVVEKDRKCIAKCRNGFRDAMAAWKPPVAAVAPPPPVAKPQPKPAPAPVPRSFIVFFDWNKADIRSDARRVIEAAAGHSRRQGAVTINLSGHADRSGPASYNTGLSLRRARAVRDMLVARGLPANRITLIGRGEGDPLVRTADGVREPRNRRVEIRF